MQCHAAPSQSRPCHCPVSSTDRRAWLLLGRCWLCWRSCGWHSLVPRTWRNGWDCKPSGARFAPSTTVRTRLPVRLTFPSMARAATPCPTPPAARYAAPLPLVLCHLLRPCPCRHCSHKPCSARAALGTWHLPCAMPACGRRPRRRRPLPERFFPPHFLSFLCWPGCLAGPATACAPSPFFLNCHDFTHPPARPR